MTDEEMAKEYVDTLLNKEDAELDKFLDETLGDLKLTIKQAGTLLGIINGVGISSFLAGLKAGRPQWHDLRKDPNDLPRQGVELLVSVDGYTRTAMYSKETNSFTCQEGVIAWMYEPEFI